MTATGILGIGNRTENWKTAQTFVKIIETKQQHLLASKIIFNAGENSPRLTENEVRIELFWKGFRDYCDWLHVPEQIGRCSGANRPP